MGNIRRIGFLVITLIALIACGCSTDYKDDPPISFLFHDYYSKSTPEEQEFIDLVNAERYIVGVNDLQVDKEIYLITTVRNIDKADNNNVNHDGIFKIKDKIILIGLNAVGENISYGYSSVVSAYNALTKSQGHYDMMTDGKWKYTAVSIVTDTEGNRYLLQLFVY